MSDDPVGKATELVKKVLTAGVGAIFLSEEALRNLVSEIKIPRELLSGILENANAARKEFFQGITAQVVEKISKNADPRKVLDEFLARNEIDFHIKVRVTPRKDAPPPSEEAAD